MNEPTGPIGIVGLGLLGSAAAERLRANGWELIGFDLDEQRRRDFARSGGEVANSGIDVLRRSGTTLLCLPSSETVLSLFEESSDVESVGHVVDATTGSPDDVAAMLEWVAARGGEYVEAKVAGSSEQLRRGEAVLLIAGSDAAITAITSLLDGLSNRRFVVGPAGAAARFKLVHNLVLGLHRAVLAEGLTFAAALGFDPGDALSILQETPAASSVMPIKGPAMILRDYPPRATLTQHLKDVRLVLESATASGASVPLSSVHARLLELATEAGFGDSDNAAVIEAFAHWSEPR